MIYYYYPVLESDQALGGCNSIVYNLHKVHNYTILDGIYTLCIIIYIIGVAIVHHRACAM